jgi:hypothetical protein
MATRKELTEALRARYRSAAYSDRIKILDEFVALTCYHRKPAIRVPRGSFSPATKVRLRNRVYDEAVAQALTVLWEPADRVCGKRLKPLIPMLADDCCRWRRTGTSDPSATFQRLKSLLQSRPLTQRDVDKLIANWISRRSCCSECTPNRRTAAR